MNGNRTPDSAIDAFLADGITELPDRTFDAVRSDIHRTRQRVVIGPWREQTMVTPLRMAAAVAVVVAAGIAWIGLSPKSNLGSPSTPAPTASATTSPTVATTPGAATLITGENHPLTLGRYVVDYGSVPGATVDGPAISFEIGATGWTSLDDYAVERNYADAISPGASLAFWNITALPVDPCTDHAPRTTAPGPEIDDVLLAVGGQQGIRAGTVTDVTIGGYRAKYVDLTITADILSCEGGFVMWGSDADGRKAQGLGEVDRLYAVDVDGQRITFFTRRLTDTAETHVRQVQAIVNSIAITP